jgi:hypothetical protein
MRAISSTAVLPAQLVSLGWMALTLNDGLTREVSVVGLIVN